MVKIIRFFLIAVLAVACLGLAVGTLLVEHFSRLASEKFGPPDSGLSLTQKMIYSYRLISNEEELLSPNDAQATPRAFVIDVGESVNSISTRLEEERFIRNADTFRSYLIYAGLDTRVQAGRFEISPAMTPLDIAGKLMDPVPEEVQFNILAGWRAEEIAASLPTSGLQISGQEFLNLVRNPPSDIIPTTISPLNSMEGFLMPGSYQVKRDISAVDLVALFLNSFNEKVTFEIRDGFTAHGLNLSEAVTLASIIQREAVIIDEQPIMASVFYNRLAAGMRLESDPTVQYSLGYQLMSQEWWKNPLSSQDLQFDSRYNTYIYPGLPPGPISNPSLSALQAVAYPDQTGFYFFRAQCDGSGRHFFAVTYDEHLNNACP